MTYDQIISNIVLTIAGALWIIMGAMWLIWVPSPNKEHKKWITRFSVVVLIMTILTIITYFLTKI